MKNIEVKEVFKDDLIYSMKRGLSFVFSNSYFLILYALIGLVTFVMFTLLPSMQVVSIALYFVCKMFFCLLLCGLFYRWDKGYSQTDFYNRSSFNYAVNMFKSSFSDFVFARNLIMYSIFFAFIITILDAFSAKESIDSVMPKEKQEPLSGSAFLFFATIIFLMPIYYFYAMYFKLTNSSIRYMVRVKHDISDPSVDFFISMIAHEGIKKNKKVVRVFSLTFSLIAVFILLIGSHFTNYSFVLFEMFFLISTVMMVSLVFEMLRDEPREVKHTKLAFDM